MAMQGQQLLDIAVQGCTCVSVNPAVPLTLFLQQTAGPQSTAPDLSCSSQSSPSLATHVHPASFFLLVLRTRLMYKVALVLRFCFALQHLEQQKRLIQGSTLDQVQQWEGSRQAAATTIQAWWRGALQRWQLRAEGSCLSTLVRLLSAWLGRAHCQYDMWLHLLWWAHKGFDLVCKGHLAGCQT